MKIFLKNIKKKLNSISTFWCAKDQLIALEKYRLYELETTLNKVKIDYEKKNDILDFGFGDGFQANYLENKKFNVSAIDIKKKNNLENNNINFLIYDGKKIPFKNSTFDIIFSSNVMEHLSNLDEIQRELFRVLKDDGICIHILPSTNWRLWTIISSVIKYWYLDPRPHGDLASNCFSELIYFSQKEWKKNFLNNNFEIIDIFQNNLFYSGNNLFGLRISLKSRFFLAKIFGSSCNIFIIKKNKKEN